MTEVELRAPAGWTCGICGSASGVSYEAREMFFGMRDRFRYVQCESCGCLQLADPPSDLSRYYPADYYSMRADSVQATGLKLAVRTSRNRYVLTGRGVTGRVLNWFFPYPMPRAWRWFARTGATRATRILDVGSGRGDLLDDLARLGYRHLVGIDPLIAGDIRLSGDARILKRTIQEVDGSFDLIMFHHSLEHIPDQLETLRAARDRLAEGGKVIVRVPTVSSYAWERYRDKWVQLEAPRHFFLHSRRSLQLLGEQAGLALDAIEDDSTEFQFIGSELYLRGIPFVEGFPQVPRTEFRRARRQAARLNQEGRGDQAVFYFSRQ